MLSPQVWPQWHYELVLALLAYFSAESNPLVHMSFFFFFCVPSHARFSVRWVRWSPQSAAVSQPVHKASCGPPPDWTMSGVSSHRRWGRIAGCGWGVKDLCRMDIRLSGKFSVCGGGRGVDMSSSESKDCDLSCSVQLVDAVLLCPDV